MKLVRVVVGVCFLAVLGLWPGRAYAVPIPWKNCGQPGDIVSVQQANSSVWPPQRGKPFTMAIRVTVAQTINAVSGTFSLTYEPPGLGSSPLAFRFTWYTRPVNIPVGPHYIFRSFTIPFWVWPGTYQIHFEEHLPTGQGVLCVDLTTPIK